MNDAKPSAKSNIATAVGAAVVGAVAGAGVVLMADQKNRDKVKNALEPAHMEKKITKMRKNIGHHISEGR